MANRIAESIDWTLQRSRISDFFRSRIKNSHDIDDITQEVMCLGISKLDEFDHEGIPDDRINDHIGGWLYGIARYKYMEFYSKQAIRKTRIDELGERGCEEIAAISTSPMDRIDGGEMAQAMQDILIGLSPALREIAFYNFMGLSADEIADRLDIEIDAVHARTSRLKKKIKAHIDGTGIGKAQLEQILISITEPSEWENSFAIKEIMPWAGGGRFSWKQFIRYIHSRKEIPGDIADALKQARRQAERIDGDKSDSDYIIDQLGALTMEIQRKIPNQKLLRKYANRIRQISPIVADIIEPICGGGS